MVAQVLIFFQPYSCQYDNIVFSLWNISSGYVLSKESVRRFVEEAIPNKDKCRQDHEGAEDAEIGR